MMPNSDANFYGSYIISLKPTIQLDISASEFGEPTVGIVLLLSTGEIAFLKMTKLIFDDFRSTLAIMLAAIPDAGKEVDLRFLSKSVDFDPILEMQFIDSPVDTYRNNLPKPPSSMIQSDDSHYVKNTHMMVDRAVCKFDITPFIGETVRYAISTSVAVHVSIILNKVYAKLNSL